MAERKSIPGKFVWYELETRDARRAQTFYREVLGWKVEPFPMGNSTYDMILAGQTKDSMIGGYAAPKTGGASAQWISYVSVPDVESAAKAASSNGGRILEPPTDHAGVGRMARIADPQGAEICLFQGTDDDPSDAKDGPAPGRFLWNELHTNDVDAALRFYERVVGFSTKPMDMGPSGTYHVISKGGVDRGGVTSHLQPGEKPHWLPYVHVEDVDATISRARKAGGVIPTDPMDIPGVGRIGLFQDPTGAHLAVIRPNPAQK